MIYQSFSAVSVGLNCDNFQPISTKKNIQINFNVINYQPSTLQVQITSFLIINIFVRIKIVYIQECRKYKCSLTSPCNAPTTLGTHEALSRSRSANFPELFELCMGFVCTVAYCAPNTLYNLTYLSILYTTNLKSFVQYEAVKLWYDMKCLNILLLFKIMTSDNI